VHEQVATECVDAVERCFVVCEISVGWYWGSSLRMM